MNVRIAILKARFKEWLAFDSIVITGLIRLTIGLTGILLFGLGSRKWSFRLVAAVHRTGRPQWFCNRLQRIITGGLRVDEVTQEAGFDSYFREHVETSPQRALKVFVAGPERMLKNRAIVVASAFTSDARGVLILDYNNVFPLFAREFDLDRIAERYHVVLEPSWTGFCNEDILCYVLLRGRSVFVESVESRDNAILDAIQGNLVRVPVAGNWWVDYRAIYPNPSVEKDLDFVMVAAWAEFKRHHRFFEALRSLRRKGHRLIGACAGYPAGLTLAEIQARAAHYGALDDIEFHESITRSEVARLMNRARVNVLWSRKEGFNRVVIEGLMCNVPCILRAGHNYGDHYPYLNEQTGRFCDERTLPQTLLQMTQAPWPGSPAKWVREHMTPQHATAILEDAIRKHCHRVGENPPERLAVKTVALHGMDYFDGNDESRFASDYAFLRSTCRNWKQANVRATAEGAAQQLL